MNNFKNAKSTVLGTGTAVYTTPAATQSVIHSIYISNVSLAEAHVTIRVGSIRLILGKAIPVGSNYVLDKPVNLIPGEAILVIADDGDNTIEAFISLMEIT